MVVWFVVGRWGGDGFGGQGRDSTRAVRFLSASLQNAANGGTGVTFFFYFSFFLGGGQPLCRTLLHAA